jgi:dihydrofolate reductase
MSRVLFEISMSLDGLITGPNVGREHPLGEGGEHLHDWMFDRRTEEDARLRDELYARTGAILIGNGMFELGYEPWGDPPPFGMPVFILTHQPREPLPMQGGTTYTFAADGIESALEQARTAAGNQDVGIWGGADVFRQYLAAGLIDEIQIHLVSLILGDGIRLFDGVDDGLVELERTRLIETPAATHLTFSVSRPG